MSLDTERIETITFDSFTTIVDVLAATRRKLAEHVDDPESVRDLWRARAVDYRMVSNFVDEYEPYMQTTREALDYALERSGVELSPDEVDDIGSVFHDLAVFDDVRSGMERLRGAGYDLYVVSNGDPELLETIVSQADIAHLLEDAVSAAEIRTYKPDEAFYRHAADRTDTDIGRIAHVATPWYDVYGAMHAGMQGVWLNRKGDPWDRFDGAPDREVDTIHEFADALDA